MKLARLQAGGRIDRSVFALFAGSYATALLLVVGLFLILDMAGNLDEYLKAGPDGNAPSSWTVAEYYALHLPFLYLQMAPFVTLVAGLFTGVRLVRDNEVVAAYNAGVSPQRLLLPLLFGAALLAIAMFALRERATESLGLRRDLLRDRLEHRRGEPVYERFWMKDAAGAPLRLGEFRMAGAQRAQHEIRDFSAHVVERGRWTSITAQRAAWNAQRGRWQLEGGTREVVEPFEQRREPLSELEQVSFTPRDVLLAVKGRDRPLELSFEEARTLAARDPDNTQYQTLLQYHLSFPLANVVLLLVGLPFLIRLERGSGLSGVGRGLLVCLFYFSFDFVSRSLGLEGALSPLLACWLPILFFGSIGLVLYDSMR